MFWVSPLKLQLKFKILAFYANSASNVAIKIFRGILNILVKLWLFVNGWQKPVSMFCSQFSTIPTIHAYYYINLKLSSTSQVQQQASVAIISHVELVRY